MRFSSVIFGVAWQLLGCASPFLWAQELQALPTLKINVVRDEAQDFQTIAARAEFFAQNLYHDAVALQAQVYAPFCPAADLKKYLLEMQENLRQALESASLRGDLRYRTQNVKHRDDARQVEVLLHIYPPLRLQAAALLLNLRYDNGAWRLDLTRYCAEALLAL